MPSRRCGAGFCPGRSCFPSRLRAFEAGDRIIDTFQKHSRSLTSPPEQAVVDDAIIDVENIVRRLREHRSSGQPGTTASVILNASLEVRAPIVYATLIIVAAAVPVFLLQGLTGAFFRPLALSYTLAIVASLVVAMTLTPALALLLLRGVPVERHTSPVVRVLHRGYTSLLSRILARPRAVYAGFALITVVGIAVTPLLGQSLFPAFKERDFLIHWVSQPGTSAAEMQRTTVAVSKELREIPGVRNFGGAHRPGVPGRGGGRASTSARTG